MGVGPMSLKGYGFLFLPWGAGVRIHSFNENVDGKDMFTWTEDNLVASTQMKHEDNTFSLCLSSLPSVKVNSITCAIQGTIKNIVETEHARYGHRPYKVMKNMIEHGKATGIKTTLRQIKEAIKYKTNMCPTCAVVKITRCPIRSSIHPALFFGTIVSTDTKTF